MTTPIGRIDQEWKNPCENFSMRECINSVAERLDEFIEGPFKNPLPYVDTVRKSCSILAQRLNQYVVQDFLKFFVPLTYTNIRTMWPISRWDYYTMVRKGNEQKGALFLGAIPLKDNIDSIVNIMREKAKGFASVCLEKPQPVAFLSVVEPHETKDGLFYQPALKAQDKKSLKNKHQIYNRHIASPDFSTLTQNQIARGVDFIIKKRARGIPVYVHCKAGRTRSATVITAYLVKKEWPAIQIHFRERNVDLEHNLDIKEKIRFAIFYLKYHRPQIAIDNANKQRIFEYFQNSKND